MPTVLRIGSYRSFFYSGDRDEPRYVHVEQKANGAKFWLDPVRLAERGGFGLRQHREGTLLLGVEDRSRHVRGGREPLDAEECLAT